MKFKNILLVGVFVFVFLISSVFAIHSVLTATDNSSEDLGHIYNISINNSDSTVNGNITDVNITIPSTFVLLTGSNGNSNGGSVSFTNTSRVLKWRNATGLIMESTNVSFWFNATASTPGVYNFTIETLNSTGIFNSNVTVTVNDTTTPSEINYDGSTPASNSNVSSSTVQYDVNATDNGPFGTITVYLYNSTSLFSSSISSTSPNSGSFTSVRDGNYTLNATVNDSDGNTNQTDSSRTFVVDSNGPAITFSCTPTSVDADDTITCSCNVSDVMDNSVNATFTVNPSTSDTGTFTTTCSSTDFTGNTGSSSVEYTVGLGSTGSSTGGGSSASTVSWKKTIPVNAANLSTGFSRVLAAVERVSVVIDSVTHHVGILSISGNTALIEIASTPKSDTFSIGQTRKYEVTDDNFYDLSVTLNSIASSKVNISVISIHEEVPADAVSNDVVNGPSGSGGSSGSELGSNESALDGELVEEGTSKGKIIVIIVLLILLVGGFIVFYSQRQF